MRRVNLNYNQAFTIAYEMAQCIKEDVEHVDSAREARKKLIVCEPKNVEEKDFLKQRLENKENFIKNWKLISVSIKRLLRRWDSEWSSFFRGMELENSLDGRR